MVPFKNILFVNERLRIKTLHGLLHYWKSEIIIRCYVLFLNLFGKAGTEPIFYSSLSRIPKRLISRCLSVIKLDITNNCNLKCKMCYIQQKAQHNDQQMNIHLFKSIINQIGNAPLRLEFLGGEPLLCDTLCELIRLTKAKTAVREIVIYTNGTLVTNKVARDLKNSGVDKAMVNFISHDSAKHDKFTGVDGSWEKAISGIANLVKAGIKTYTFTVLHSENYCDYALIHDFVLRQLKISPLFYQYVPQSRNDPLGISTKAWQCLKGEILQKYCKKHCNFMVGSIISSGRFCFGGHFMVSIKSDGSVTPCPFIHDLRLGNVKQDSIWDIFAHANKNRQFLSFSRLPYECRGCSYKNICSGGCRAGNIFVEKNYEARDYHCLGPWIEPLRKETVHDRLPNFF